MWDKNEDELIESKTANSASIKYLKLGMQLAIFVIIGAAAVASGFFALGVGGALLGALMGIFLATVISSIATLAINTYADEKNADTDYTIYEDSADTSFQDSENFNEKIEKAKIESLKNNEPNSLQNEGKCIGIEDGYEIELINMNEKRINMDEERNKSNYDDVSSYYDMEKFDMLDFKNLQAALEYHGRFCLELDRIAPDFFFVVKNDDNDTDTELLSYDDFLKKENLAGKKILVLKEYGLGRINTVLNSSNEKGYEELIKKIVKEHTKKKSLQNK